ncbi:EthD family reductase [Falsiroseomonas sp. E2-1-a20]|uniref:EthD family reductase n=1 Tax=Falsiroseomonas sp. E2-1-a20 TaxID=3239300 RepID=UPI003F392536
MVILSVMYPAPPGSSFDQEYYLNEHTALLWRCWKEMGLREVRILRGTGSPGDGPATYGIIALLTFESAGALQKAVASHGAEIFADIPKFTNVQPVVQINESLPSP